MYIFTYVHIYIYSNTHTGWRRHKYSWIYIYIQTHIQGGEKIYTHVYIYIYKHTYRVANTYIHMYIYIYTNTHTGWRRPIGCLKLQVISRKRASNYRPLLRKMTCKDKASCDSKPPCTYKACLLHRHLCCVVCRYHSTNPYAYVYIEIHSYIYIYIYRSYGVADYGMIWHKCCIHKIHQIQKLRFFVISWYKFELRFYFNLNLYWGIWVSGSVDFGGFSILSENYHNASYEMISRYEGKCEMLWICILKKSWSER